MIATTAALCLAANLYFESRSEPIMGQYAVALVTMNRARQDKGKVCTEVFKSKQFSWTNTGVKKVAGGWKIADPKEAHAWWLAQRIADTTLAGKMPDFTHGSTHYHTTAVRPVWRLALAPTKQIGKHLFYSG